MLRGKERGTNLCFTFQNKGNCARGTACKFDHTPPTESPCYDFIHGRCKREADCRYSHALAREQMAPRGRSQGKGKGGPPNTDRGDSSKESAKMKNLQTACFDFIHGRCSRYEACRYSHALAREQMRQRGQADGGDPTDGESRESILKHIADDKSKFMKNRKRSRDDDAQLAVRKRVRAPRRNRRRGGKNKDDKNVWITVLPPIHYQPSADQSRFGGGPGARQPRSFGMPMPMQSSQQPPNNVVRPPKFTGFKPAPEKSVPTPEDFASFFEDSVDMSDGDEPMFPETQAGSLQKRSCDLVERKAIKMKSEFPQPKRILPSENMSQRPDTRPPFQRPDTRPPFQRPDTRPPFQRPDTRPPFQRPDTRPQPYPQIRPSDRSSTEQQYPQIRPSRQSPHYNTPTSPQYPMDTSPHYPASTSPHYQPGDTPMPQYETSPHYPTQPPQQSPYYQEYPQQSPQYAGSPAYQEPQEPVPAYEYASQARSQSFGGVKKEEGVPYDGCQATLQHIPQHPSQTVTVQYTLNGQPPMGTTSSRTVITTNHHTQVAPVKRAPVVTDHAPVVLNHAAPQSIPPNVMQTFTQPAAPPPRQFSAASLSKTLSFLDSILNKKNELATAAASATESIPLLGVPAPQAQEQSPFLPALVASMVDTAAPQMPMLPLAADTGMTPMLSHDTDADLNIGPAPLGVFSQEDVDRIMRVNHEEKLRLLIPWMKVCHTFTSSVHRQLCELLVVVIAQLNQLNKRKNRLKEPQLNSIIFQRLKRAFFDELLHVLPVFPEASQSQIRKLIEVYPSRLVIYARRAKPKVDPAVQPATEPAVARKPPPTFIPRDLGTCKSCATEKDLVMCNWCMSTYCKQCVGDTKPPCSTCQTHMSDFDYILLNQSISFKNGLRRMRESFTAKDNDVQETSFVLPLFDTYTQARLEVPTKGRDCEHRNLFDLRSFLQRKGSKSSAPCPICNKRVAVNSLEVDHYISRILMTENSDVREVCIRADGTWNVGGEEDEGASREFPDLPPDQRPSIDLTE
eukprot:501881_1